MKIELKTFFRGRRKGTVVDWPDGLANELVARGIAAEVVERAVAEERMETATISQKAAGRKVVKR